MTTLKIKTPTGLAPVKAYTYRSSASKVGICCTVAQAGDPAFVAAVAAKGTGWLRFDAFWAYIETAQGSYSWSGLDAAINTTIAAGMKPLVIIQTTPQWVSGSATVTMGPVTAAARTAYANFCRTLALRYMEKLGGLEIWNEANLEAFWKPTPSVADYIALARPAVAAIRAVLPTVPIISQGIGGAGSAPSIGHAAWLDAFYSQGGHLKTPGTPSDGLLFDGIGVHDYEDLPGIGWGVGLVKTRMTTHSAPQPVWLTECGAPTAPPGTFGQWTVTEARQAEVITATVDDFVSRSPQGVCCLYSAKDRNSSSTTDREDRFGIIWRSDGTEKPAAATYAASARKSRLVPLAQAPTIVSPPPLTFDAAFPAAGVMGSYSDPNPNNLVTGGTTVDSTDPALDVWLVSDPVTPSRVVACCDSRNGKTEGNASPRASMTTGLTLPQDTEYWQVFSWNSLGYKIPTDDWNALWTGAFGPPYNGPSPTSLALQPTAAAGKNLLRFSRTAANGGVNWSGVDVPANGWIQVVAHYNLATAGGIELWVNTGPGPNSFVKVVPWQALSILAPGATGLQYSSLGVYGPLPKRILFGVHQIATGPNGKLALTPDDFGAGFNPALLP